MLKNYPWELNLIFAFLTLSLLFYIFDLIIIIQSKTYKEFFIRLYIYAIITQFLSILPQMIVPFLISDYKNYEERPSSQEHRADPGSKYLSAEWCRAQTIIVNVAVVQWALLSLYMSFGIVRILKGKSFKPTCAKEFFICVVILFFSLGVGVLLWLSKNDQYSITSKGRLLRYYCQINLEHKTYIEWSLLLIIGFLLISTAIVLVLNCAQKQRMKKQYHLKMNHPIIRHTYFTTLIIVSYLFNFILKVIQMIFEDFPSEHANFFLNGLWVLLQSYIYSEGFFVSLLFLAQYDSFLKQRLQKHPILQQSVQIINLANPFRYCCFRNKVRVDHFEDTLMYLQDDDQDQTKIFTNISE